MIYIIQRWIQDNNLNYRFFLFSSLVKSTLLHQRNYSFKTFKLEHYANKKTNPIYNV